MKKLSSKTYLENVLYYEASLVGRYLIALKNLACIVPILKSKKKISHTENFSEKR